jgi:hypothetical protein
MCQKCADLMKKYYPLLDDYTDILMNYTSFPFGSPEQIEKEIIHLQEVGPEVVSREIDERMGFAVAAANEGKKDLGDVQVRCYGCGELTEPPFGSVATMPGGSKHYLCIACARDD